MQRVPARTGDPVDAIATPALVVDLDAFERNLDRMAGATAGIRLRPHAKAHKCSAIARAQLDRGAIGICCQKTDEAAAFVEAGVRDVLVTNEVVDAPKLARLAELARVACVGVLVDALPGVAALSCAAERAATTIDVYVEIDVGAHRCGVAPGEAARELARAIADAPALCFRGLHAYHGAAQHLRDPAARRAAIASAAEAARATRALVGAVGIACEIVTGAGTGTWRHERDSGVYNELQPGSYVFMDADYARNAGEPADLCFEQSLFVLASVMSVPARERAVVDAGLKAFSFDSGPPLVHGHRGVVYAKASD
ncbi:MAG: DSD1 family PLP-dependent enzyme, partial [Proteobacteria bacterium]|nr:DSD1 family PLP-dependent enzyme [Pseudomonadota bacterium]